MSRGQRRWGGFARSDTGASAVEFALVLIPLLLILLGILNFGYVFGQKLALNQAAREGARKAVVNAAATQSTIESDVRNATGGLIRSTTDVVVRSDIQTVSGTTFGAFLNTGTGACSQYSRMGGQLRVRATYAATWLVSLPIPLSAPTLTSEAVFRCEAI